MRSMPTTRRECHLAQTALYIYNNITYPKAVPKHMSPLTIVIVKHPRDPQYDAAALALAAAEAAAGRETMVLPDLYHLDDDHPVWEALRNVDGPASVYGPLYPRATEWLLRRHSVRTEGWEFHTIEPAAEAPESRRPGVEQAARERWYPVVDGTECTNCQHCLQFCLFGVYEQDAGGQVCVTNPDSCKAGCPACSRVCPQGAIMFPLYAQDPAIAGAPGRKVERDAEARRMFYTRTGKVCTVCQKPSAELSQVMPDGTCPECGRQLPRPSDSPMLKEIDDLIDRLDQITGGGN
ncbi:MAG: hypothetical protein ABFD94_01830, partial [Armatimonadia bacterium]